MLNYDGSGQREHGRRWTCVLVAGGMLLGLTAAGEAAVDEAALDRIQEAVQRNSAAETVQFDLQVTLVQAAQGQEQEAVGQASVNVQRPDQLAIRTDEVNPLINTIVIDSEQYHESAPQLDGYVERPAPADLAAAWRGEGVAESGGGGWVVMLGPVLDRTVFDAVRDAVLQADRVGDEQIEGEATERVRLRIGPVREIESLPAAMRQNMPDVELVFDVWTTTGDEPEIRRIVPDLMEMLAQQGQQMPAGADLRMEMALADWQLDEPIDDDAFDYEPAEGALQAESLGELHEARQGGNPAEQLAGKPAPGFKLEQLDGGQVDLADHFGENIVILDFWATWCGPCVQTMPIYQRIMADYGDQDVQIYAVNLQEDEDQVTAFLNEHDLTLPVLLDRQGRVARQYHARAIPQSVLIGPDGTVQAVHVGALPNLEQQLRSELDTLLAGDSLVE